MNKFITIIFNYNNNNDNNKNIHDCDKNCFFSHALNKN